jgi:hypothetical protein
MANILNLIQQASSGGDVPAPDLGSTQPEPVEAADVPDAGPPPEQPMEGTGFFSPEGDPYSYRQNGDTVQFIHNETGRTGEVSTQQVAQKNPEFARRHLDVSMPGDVPESEAQAQAAEQAKNTAQRAEMQANADTSRKAQQNATGTPVPLSQAGGTQPQGPPTSNMSSAPNGRTTPSRSDIEGGSGPGPMELLSIINEAQQVDRDFQKIGGGPGLLADIDVSGMSALKGAGHLVSLLRGSESVEDIFQGARSVADDLTDAQKLQQWLRKRTEPQQQAARPRPRSSGASEAGSNLPSGSTAPTPPSGETVGAATEAPDEFVRLLNQARSNSPDANVPRMVQQRSAFGGMTDVASNPGTPPSRKEIELMRLLDLASQPRALPRPEQSVRGVPTTSGRVQP